MRDRLTIDERLRDMASELRAKAELLPNGPSRDKLLAKARENEMTAEVNVWITSPGLQPPD